MYLIPKACTGVKMDYPITIVLHLDGIQKGIRFTLLVETDAFLLLRNEILMLSAIKETSSVHAYNRACR